MKLPEVWKEEREKVISDERFTIGILQARQILAFELGLRTQNLIDPIKVIHKEIMYRTLSGKRINNTV